MGFLKKKPDPISDKARALNQEIAALEAEIKRLDSKVSRNGSPKIRSTTLPQGGSNGAASGALAERTPPPSAPNEPVFENVTRGPLTKVTEGETPEIYNELGVRRYDLPAFWKRLRTHFRGPTTSNPRLINYLAAGGVQGLRPLRYEKRVARNRFLAFTGLLFAILLGLLWVYLKHH